MRRPLEVAVTFMARGGASGSRGGRRAETLTVRREVKRATSDSRRHRVLTSSQGSRVTPGRVRSNASAGHRSHFEAVVPVLGQGPDCGAAVRLHGRDGARVHAVGRQLALPGRRRVRLAGSGQLLGHDAVLSQQAGHGGRRRPLESHVVGGDVRDDEGTWGGRDWKETQRSGGSELRSSVLVLGKA